MCLKMDEAASAKDPYAESADGHFVGVKSWNGATVFHGILYARYERFGMPVEVDYDGVCDAREYGCVCPQDLTHLLGQLGADSGLEMREGELCLSVTVPSVAAEKLPVMVWIHGGFYMTGGSEDHRYDVSRLAETGNVVVVKISYRLGAEGYMWMPERGVANLGLADQKTALRWIRRHIASFGGDPDNVTLFGQSAGAHSIASLIASADDVEPETNVPRFGGEVLFHRAILQSPPLGNTISPKAAARVTDVFMKKIGGFEKCMSVSVGEIIAAQNAVKSMRLGLVFLPVLQDYMRIPPAAVSCGDVRGVGGHSCCGATAGNDGNAHAGNGKKEGFRVLLGYNADDASPYIRKWAGFLWRTPLRRSLVKFLTDRIFRKPTLRYAERLRKAGIDARTYCIGWHPQGSELGACHSVELPFLLGNYEDWTAAEMLHGMSREEFERNSAVMQRLWTKFARSGEFPATGVILQ